MKLIRSIAFRIWVIFTVLGLTISIPLALYYNNWQLSLLQEHSKEEFDVNARITANAVKTALEMDDFVLLQRLLKDIQKNDNYAYIAVVENLPDGSRSVVTCTPERFKNRVIRSNEDKYFYSHSPISTEVLNGEIIIASSKSEDLLVLKQLNRPLIYLTVIALIISTFLFGFSILFLSRPIFKAVEVAKALGTRNYDVQIDQSKGTNEISVLNNSLFQLRQNLVDLDNENKNLLNSLEERINEITIEIENKNRVNKLLLDVSRVFLESKLDQDRKEVIRKTLKIISNGLGFTHTGIFKMEQNSLFCQYNVENGPLQKVFTKNVDPQHPLLSEKYSKGLILFNKEALSKNSIWKDVFSEFPNVRAVYLYFFKDTNGAKEFMIMSSDRDADDMETLEIQGMLDVYISLYSNFSRGKEFEGQLKELNKTLETKVLEKTRVNLEISNSLIAQDKLVTIGELSAGVAHDLNTPLASIKAASQNLRSVMKSLFSRVSSFNEEELNLALKLVETYPEQNIFRNSIEKMKIAARFKDLIEQKTGSQDDRSLASLFADSGFVLEQEQAIEEILQTTDPMRTLKLLKDLFLLQSFLFGIESSVDRSTEVISNLSRFVREDLTQKKERIDLSNSVKIVEALFRFRLRGNIELTTEVEQGSFIMGIEMKLFQVWTNIVKNAIDAFEESQQEKKSIRIYSDSAEDQVTIYFENNGPKIPEEDVQRIFKKFYTTKQKRNGTGLGLSIVSNIIAEHYGKLHLSSDDERTVFSITFPKAVAEA